MTVIEYYQKKSGYLGLDFTDQALTDFIEVSGYVVGDSMDDADKYDKTYFDLIKSLLLRPQSVSEAQYSITYDLDALMRWITMESRRLGIDTGIGQVRDMSYLA